MKKHLLLISILLLYTNLYSQELYDDWYNLNFDTTIAMDHIRIDTVSKHSIWQIGSPDKIIFKSASSLPNAIVTGLTNSYPINDTSAFTIVNVAFGAGFEWPHTVLLEAEYYVNSDTLTDYGTI